MKYVIVALLFISFIIETSIMPTSATQDKVFGKPLNHKWVIKSDRRKGNGNIIVFSEDGKIFIPISDIDDPEKDYYDKNIYLWSPDGRYVIWIYRGVYVHEDPYIKDGF